MSVLILSANHRAYEIARALAVLGVATAYYERSSDYVGLDENDVVHIGSWRPHLTDAALVIVDDPALLLAYRQTGHEAPVLYQPTKIQPRQITPEASDYLASLMLGTSARRRWWRRNGGV